MKILTKVKQHILQNIKAYLWVAAAFSLGAFTALFSVMFLGDSENCELVLYMDDFFKNVSVSGVDAKAVLKISSLDNLKTVILAFLFSLMIIGAPFICIICAFLGYSSCFTLFFMLKNYGFKSLLFFGAALFPHWLILFPLYAFFMASCFNFVLMPSGYVKGREQRKNILELIFVVVIVLALSFCASLIQAYVEPWFIGFISKYYI